MRAAFNLPYNCARNLIAVQQSAHGHLRFVYLQTARQERQADTMPADVKFGFDVLDVSECCCLMDERRCRIDEERVGIPVNNSACWHFSLAEHQ